MLGLAPIKDKFLKVLISTLKGIPSVLCTNAVPMDGSITDQYDTTGDDTESSAGQKSEMTKSLDNLRLVLTEKIKIVKLYIKTTSEMAR